MSESSLKKAPHSHDHGGHSHTAGEPHTHSHEGHDHGAEDEHSHGHGGKSEGSMNMEGVFLHVLGDAVGFSSRTLSDAFHLLLLDIAWKCWSHWIGINHLVNQLFVEILFRSCHQFDHHVHHLLQCHASW
jgi:hypothetical protein